MEITERVRKLIKNFTSDHGKLPNMIYLGHEELEEAKANYNLISFKPEELIIQYMFGTKVTEICKESYLSVGIVIEEKCL